MWWVGKKNFFLSVPVRKVTKAGSSICGFIRKGKLNSNPSIWRAALTGPFTGKRSELRGTRPFKCECCVTRYMSIVSFTGNHQVPGGGGPHLKQQTVVVVVILIITELFLAAIFQLIVVFPQIAKFRNQAHWSLPGIFVIFIALHHHNPSCSFHLLVTVLS